MTRVNRQKADPQTGIPFGGLSFRAVLFRMVPSMWDTWHRVLKMISCVLHTLIKFSLKQVPCQFLLWRLASKENST